MLPHTLPQILSIIKAKAHNEKVKKSEFIAAFYLYSILLVHNAVVDSGFYVSVGSIHPVPKIRGGPTLGSRSFFRSRKLYQTMNTVYFITDLWSQGNEDPASKIILLCPVALSLDYE